MTLPAIPPSSPTRYTTPDKNPNNIKKEANKLYLPESEQQYDRKSIAEFKTIKKHQSTEKPSTELFITNLPEALRNELTFIQNHCIFNDKLVEILNGHGIFYNRLIILLIKIDHIMAEKGFSDKQKLEVEDTVNRLLTGGKFNLVRDIGRELNHIEDCYQSKSWFPNPEDRSLFDQDHESCVMQQESGDFCPKWMKETEIIPGIPASEATLAYWNFRHSEENDDRGRLSDTLIKKKDPGLFHWILELRKLKTAFLTPDIDALSSSSSLTKFHVGAITARFNHSDEAANSEAKTNSDYRTYCWDVQSSNTQNRRKRKGKQRSDTDHTTEKTLKENARFSPASSTSSFEEEDKSTYPQTSTSDRPKRMRRPNPKYQDFTPTADMSSRKSTPSLPDAYKKISRKESEDLLKETGIPELEITIGSVLEKERQRLVEHLDITTFRKNEYSYRWELVDVMSAQDELSRLYEACRRHLGSYKSSYTGKMNEDPIDIPKEQKKIDASLKADKIFECEKSLTRDEAPKITMRFSDREQELLKARNALITLLDRAEDLSSKPAKIQVPIEEDDDAPAWESLEAVIRSPMTSLKKVLEHGNSHLSDVEMQEISPTLEEDTKELIRKYRYRADVWDPADARDHIQGKINKLKKLQSIFLKARNSILNTKQNLKKTDYKKEDNQKINRQLDNIQTVLRNTAIVLILLQDFSSHLKSERHRELYDRLSKALESWGKCMRDTPINQLLTA